jgi:hypothetical protein
VQAACPTRPVQPLDCRKIRLLVIAPEVQDELDDIGAHEGTHTAIPIRPISASDTRSSAYR